MKIPETVDGDSDSIFGTREIGERDSDSLVGRSERVGETRKSADDRTDGGNVDESSFETAYGTSQLEASSFGNGGLRRGKASVSGSIYST
jgi:hypothetical protein